MKLVSNYLGLVEYHTGLQIQTELLGKAQQNANQHYVIGLEHPAVVTLGYRAVAENEILPFNKIKVEKTARGGFATLHSEGQLVIYPVINLRQLKIGVRDFICVLLNTTKNVLKVYGVNSSVGNEAPGLYTDKGKIAFCGIHVSHGITQHGISVNISNDLGLFRNIKSCGIENAEFDRLCDYVSAPDLAGVYSDWIREFQTQVKNQLQ